MRAGAMSVTMTSSGETTLARCRSAAMTTVPSTVTKAMTLSDVMTWRIADGDFFSIVHSSHIVSRQRFLSFAASPGGGPSLPAFRT